MLVLYDYYLYKMKVFNFNSTVPVYFNLNIVSIQGTHNIKPIKLNMVCNEYF